MAQRGGGIRRRRLSRGGGNDEANENNNMLQFHTDETVGLMLSPTTVLTISIGFIVFVSILHAIGKLYLFPSNTNSSNGVLKLAHNSFSFPPKTPASMAEITTITDSPVEEYDDDLPLIPNLETWKSERHVWLMKCPSVVSRFLHPHQTPDALNGFPISINNDAPIAKVTVIVDPLLPTEDISSTQYTMELAGSDPGNVPKVFSLDMSKDIVPMSVFSESSQGKLSAEGKIHRKFDMRPHHENIGDYGRLCRERTNKYLTKPRRIQVIDDDNGKHMRPMPGIFSPRLNGSAFIQDKKKRPAKGSEMKRTRRDREEMEEIMFKLFERQPNWTLKQLIHETDQPEQFLKDMLKLLCVYNNKGANQGSYELKSEYKKSEDNSDLQ
ncbi:hypothetical protein Leryth_015585 [Lithospermum erythrorhizon]|nr:hypothetical protein Leryth_015585 [Lithospermum erythrorhizon]